MKIILYCCAEINRNSYSITLQMDTYVLSIVDIVALPELYSKVPRKWMDHPMTENQVIVG